jgi:hypothetical protein
MHWQWPKNGIIVKVVMAFLAHLDAYFVGYYAPYVQ